VLEAVMSLGIVSKGATVTLAHAVEHPVPLFVAPTLEAVPCDARAVEEWCAAADAYLTGVGPRVRAGGMNVRTRVQVGANVAAQLLELARSGAHDLVAVGMRSGRGLQRLILGSIADKVVRAAEQPVLVVPVPREDRGRVEPAAGSAAEAPRPASVEAA
jgi:nucleotide-binding universal stress UspA family protein